MIPSNQKLKTGQWFLRTIAGSGAGEAGAVAEDDLYLQHQRNQQGRRRDVDNHVGSGGWKDGPANLCQFQYPVGVAVVWLQRGTGGQKQTCQCVAICDRGNKRIRLLYPGSSKGQRLGEGKWFVQTIVGSTSKEKKDRSAPKEKVPNVLLSNITGTRHSPLSGD